MDATQYLVVRTLHVLGAALVFGGSTVLWIAFRVDRPVPVRLLSWFEGLFWGVIGLLVFTGVGNLVAFGVPGIESPRGTVLAVKLGLAIALGVGSVIRTTAVVRLENDATAETTNRFLGWLYAMTALAIGILVAVAGVLARG